MLKRIVQVITFSFAFEPREENITQFILFIKEALVNLLRSEGEGPHPFRGRFKLCERNRQKPNDKLETDW
jgi:hypothetical protein